jgi:hypothetical protein
MTHTGKVNGKDGSVQGDRYGWAISPIVSATVVKQQP